MWVTTAPAAEPYPDPDLTGTLEEEDGGALRADSDPAELALALARDAHRGQRDRFGRDFIEHPIAVADLCLPFTGPVGLVPAYLHDTVEKAGVDPLEIERLFGPEVKTMVEVLGQDGSIGDSESRREDHRRRVAAAGSIERAVYLSDRRDGILTLTALLRNGRESDEFEAVERVRLWRGDLDAVDPDLVDPALGEAIGIELETLASLLA